MRSPRKPDRKIVRARALRRSMTDAEKKLWWHLRRLPIETTHFRRQAPIGPYFADFACHKHRILIEVDGGGHAEARQIAADAARTAYLKSRGYRVFRFWNNEVLKEIDGVMSVIYAAIHDDEAPPTPDPSPPRASRSRRSASAFLGLKNGGPRPPMGGGEPRGRRGEPEGPA
jgi:very-short-patch-repair endonuclease